MAEGRTGTYVAAVIVSDRERGKLLRIVKPVHPTVVAHHMTIVYDPTREEFWEKYARLVGQKVTLTVGGKADNDRVQAAVITSGPASINAVKHVTISTALGVEAVESNELLKNGWTELEPRMIQAVIQNLSIETDLPV
jgi:hypothetical protein